MSPVWHQVFLSFGPLGIDVIEFESKFKPSLSRQRILVCHLQNGAHFVSVVISGSSTENTIPLREAWVNAKAHLNIENAVKQNPLNIYHILSASDKWNPNLIPIFKQNNLYLAYSVIHVEILNQWNIGSNRFFFSAMNITQTWSF